ncbi:MAG: nucleotidyltransferase domain-containing protein [Candidatus Margulisiibacteriota bacterium]
MKLPESIIKKYQIAAVFLFGSRAARKAGPLSDYDFGVQLKKTINPSEYDEIKLKLTAEFAHLASCNLIDVVIMNNAPLLLKYQIFKYGKVIYDGNPSDRARLMFETLREYLDWSYFEGLTSRALIKRTAERGLNV